MTAPESALAALATATYRKSSYTAANGECVLIAHAAGWTGIQDSKQTPRTTIAATHLQFTALLDALRSDQLEI